MSVSRPSRHSEGSPAQVRTVREAFEGGRSELYCTARADLKSSTKRGPVFRSRRDLLTISLLVPLYQICCAERGTPELVETGSCDTPGWAHDVVPDAGKVYVADRQGGLLVFERSVPLKPPAILTPVEDVISLSPNGGNPLLAARFEGVVLVSPDGRVRGRVSNGDIANAVATCGELAFAAYGKHGLVVARIDRAGIRVIGELPTPGWSHDVKLWEGRALLADWDYGLRVVDIRDPERPREISTLPTPATAISIAIDRTRRIVAIAEGHGGVSLAELSATGSPRLLSRHPLGLNPADLPHPEEGGWAHSVAWCGRYLLIANWKRGLALLDTRDPGEPHLVLEKDTGGTALGVAVEPGAGGTSEVYLADGESGLCVFRFSAR